MIQKITGSNKAIATKQSRILVMGDKYILIVPKPLVDCGVLELDKEYLFEIKEVEQNEKRDSTCKPN